MLRKWTPEEDGRLLKLVAAGKSPFVIAKEFKKTVAAVLGRIATLKKRQNIPLAENRIQTDEGHRMNADAGN